MKKLLNKIKLKHFARVALFMILTCHLLMFLCSASLTVNVLSDGDSDDGYSVTLIYNDTQGVNTDTDFAYGDDLTISYHNSDIYHSDYICDSGTLTPLVDGLSELTDVDLPDGYYNVLLACVSVVDTYNGYDNYAILADLGSPLITVTDDDYSIEHVSYYYYSDTVPDDVCVYFSRDIQGEGDYSSDTIIISALIVPVPPPPPPQDTITNVWSGVLTFLISSISTVTNVFWDGSSLTLFGTLGLIGVTIAIIILVFLRVKDFLKLR